MPHPQPSLIGIAGASGSGKTELAQALARRFGHDQCIVLPLDAYYQDLSELPPSERAAHNFDTSDAVDWDLFRTDVGALITGAAIDRPIYDFATHTRRSDSVPVTATAFVVIDGLLALVEEWVRSRMQVKVFVETPDDVCLARRIARDTVERGRTRESVVRQYEATVRPMYEQHVAPTRAFADLIVRGDRPVELAVESIFAHIRARGLAHGLQPDLGL